MTRVQFGWVLPNGPSNKSHRGSFLAEVYHCLALVSSHFESAWITDHLQLDQADRLEAWTALTYLSALHPQLMFGHAVLCQSFRNPALLAKMAATFQYMSGGRLILGIGAGWKEDEYLAYGYKFPSASTRLEELDEALQIIKALWHNEQATIRGRHYHVVDAWCEPKPDPTPKIMVGGSKPRILRLIARYADWWTVSWTGIDDYREQVAECKQACEEVGRDPATLRRIWFGGCVCASTEDAVETLNKGRMNPKNSFVGTPVQIIEQMRQFVALGVDYFLLSGGGLIDIMTLEMLVNEVLPALNP